MDYREMNRLADSPASVRDVATFILAVASPDLTERSHDFLVTLQKYDGSKLLSTRQKEALFSLRERATRRSTVGRYRASTLVRLASERCLDLTDFEDAEWLQELTAFGANLAVSNGQWRRLIRISKDLEVVPNDEWIPL